MGKIFHCHHEDWCSQPGTYWQFKDHTVIMNEYGQVIEEVVSDKPVTNAVCTECGSGADLFNEKAVDILNKWKEKAEQPALI